MTKPIHVIGHRNPDTDSICSAIAYAYLKQAMGENAIPARAGKLNAETKYILKYFNIEAPVYIDDFYPRVKDVMGYNPISMKSGDNLKDLGQMIKSYGLRSIPVTDENNSLIGIISESDLAQRYFDELEMQDLCNANVSFIDIIKVLDGELICGENPERKVSGKVKILASKTSTMLTGINKGEIGLVGDRETSHIAAIKLGVDCLIITCNAEVEAEVKKLAESYNTLIITSPYDTYTCARLINQSIPVQMIMHKNVISFKPTDLISDIKPLILNSNHNNYPVIENGKLIGIIGRENLISQERDKVILVDHNEYAQAVEGVEEAQILEMIDHHRLGGIQTGEPIFIRHEPVGSTATIIANMIWHRNVKMKKVIASLLLSAIISDTVLFKSPTSTQADKETAEKLAKIANIDIENFGMEILKAGSDIDNLSPSKIVHNDLKEYQIENNRIAIGQFSVLTADKILNKQIELLKYLNSLQTKENYDMTILMITDILKESTYLIFTNEANSLISKTFENLAKDNLLFLQNVMSRKKQIIPPLVEASRRE
jgi:manganese-dependent inorganic pyrophosphatase